MRAFGLIAAPAIMLAGCSADPVAQEATDPAPVETVDSTTTSVVGPGPGELSANIVFEWADGACGVESGPIYSRLHRVDVREGEIDWSVDTPWAPAGPVILDEDTVALVGGTLERPTIVAYDLATGAGRWQRTPKGSQAQLFATDGDAVAVEIIGFGFTADRELLLIDADGEATASAIPPGGVAHNDDGPPWWQSRYVIGPDGAPWDPFAEPAQPLDFGGFSDYQAVVIGDAAITADGDRVGFSDGRNGWEAAVPVDAEFSTMVDVRVGTDSVLVLLGSEVGPNRRLVVLDRDDGAVRWTLDGIRDADVAGNRVIYDRRTDAVDRLTREVFVVDQDDPAAVAWSALSDQPLGGFLGTLDGRDHFVHRDPSIFPRAPYPEVGGVTEAQHFEPELRIVGEDGPEETPMHSGPQDVARAPGPKMAAGDGWTAVIIGDLVWLTVGDQTTTIDLDGSPQHLLAAGDTLVATTGVTPFGCD